MGDSAATGRSELEGFGGSMTELKITTVYGFRLRPLLDIPALGDIENKLKGTKLLDVLISTIALHPTSTKNTTLEQSTKMLGIRDMISQEDEVWEKLE